MLWYWCIIASFGKLPRCQSSWGQHWAHLGHVGPIWAPWTLLSDYGWNSNIHSMYHKGTAKIKLGFFSVVVSCHCVDVTNVQCRWYLSSKHDKPPITLEAMYHAFMCQNKMDCQLAAYHLQRLPGSFCQGNIVINRQRFFILVGIISLRLWKIHLAKFNVQYHSKIMRCKIGTHYSEKHW